MATNKRTQRKNLIPFSSLNDEDKQNVVNYIQRNGVSILQATIDLNMTRATINKIFSEKFGKRDRIIDEIKKEK